MKNLKSEFALLGLTLAIAAYCSGQDQDTAKEFNIDADKWERNFKTGETLFTGNVKMRHGAFIIEAESLVAIQKNNILEKAVAEGTPASFQQLPSESEGRELVNASGNQIEFVDTAEEQSVKITSNALLQQGGITAVCNQITFILENGVVQHMDGSRGDSQCQVSSTGNTNQNNNTE